MTRFPVAVKATIVVFLLASLAVLISIYWKSEVLLEGRHTDLFLKYYVGLTISIVFWGTLLFLNRRIQLNTILVVCSVLVALYIAEIALYAVGLTRPLPKELASVSQNISYDRKTKFEIAREYRAKGYPAIPYTAAKSNWILINGQKQFILGNISNHLTIYCNESGTWSIYQSDRYGYNNSDSVWDHDEVDGLLIGDSFTQGACVKPEDNIAGQLRNLLNEKSFINLGASGTSALYQYASLVEYGQHKKPKNVIWFYFEGNDLLELDQHIGRNKLLPYLEKGFTANLKKYQNLIDQKLLKEISIIEKKFANSEIEQPATKADVAFYKLRHLMLLGNLRWASGFNNLGLQHNQEEYIVGHWQSPMNMDSIDNQTLSILRQILSGAKQLIQTWNGKLYFVYLPTYERYTSAHAVKIFLDEGKYLMRNKVLEIVRQLDIQLIDIHEEVFSKASDPIKLFPLRVPGHHYTAEAYRKIAEVVGESIDPLAN